MQILLIILGFLSRQVSSEQPTTEINSTGESCNQITQRNELFRRSLFTINKCVGENYAYGHQIRQFWNECTIEPENKLLSYEDSVWKFYKCIVQKSLGTQPLTLTSYAELMTGNMSATTRSAIMSILTTSQSQEEMESTTDGDRMTTETDLESFNSKSVLELGDIKKYWDRYFDAEFQVCSSTVQKCNKTKLDFMRTYSWKSQKVCKNGNVPKKLKDEFGTYEQFINCTDSLQDNHTFTNTTKSDIRSAALRWCMISPKLEMNGLKDENKLLDFELLYNKSIVPKFYSKSVQENTFKIIRKEFSLMYPRFEESIMASKSIKEIVSYAAKKLSEQFRKKGHSEENLMFLTNSSLLFTLVYGGENALSRICNWGLHVK